MFCRLLQRCKIATTGDGYLPHYLFPRCSHNQILNRQVHYEQGQSPEPKIREYFYFIDHQGQLFLDDSKMKNFTSCFKEKDFLAFFFKRLKRNDTNRYRDDFPYLSPCGPERNYIRCDDRPIVITHILPGEAQDEEDIVSYNWGGDRLTIPFEPQKLCMYPDSGRVYHPAPKNKGGVALVRSMIAIELSKSFGFDNGETAPPTSFTWKGVDYKLTNELFDVLEKNPV